MADVVNSGMDIGSNVTMSYGTRDQSGNGAAVIPAPGAGKRILVRGIYGWCTTEGESNSVSLILGSFTFAAMPLVSNNSVGMTMLLGEHILCAENSPVYINLNNTNEVGFICFYDVV